MGIDGTKWIIKNVNVSLGINGASNCNALLLPPGQVDALFSNFGLISLLQNVQIRL